MSSAERRTCLVTGASRGLGAAIARRLGADGWSVAVNYRSDATAADRVVDDIRAAGGTAESFHGDATDETGVTTLVAAAGQRLGPVTAVVANATGPQPEARLEDLTWRAYLDQLEFFVLSPTLLVQAALPAMRRLGGGRVILIGSDLADRAAPGWSAYVAAKNAQVGLTKVWAKELGPDSITVNLVQPGWIPRRAARGRRHVRVRGRGPATPDGRAGRRGPPGRLPRLGRRRVHHRPEDHGQRRPRALTRRDPTAAGREAGLPWRNA